MHQRLRPFLLVLAATLVATLGFVGPQTQQAAAAVDVYVTPGYHTVNGRDWHTECEAYSGGERCWTQIWSTQVVLEQGVYREQMGWTFNNLTYHKMPKSQWAGNPLAADGTWTGTDGRLWRTECNTPQTGGNGCRSYVTSTQPRVITITPRVLGTTTVEVFNSMIRFSPEPIVVPEPEPLCNAAPLPSGFAMTPEGLPHSTKPPYTPIDLYNPTSVSNFVRVVTKKVRDMQSQNAPKQQIEDQKCLALVAGEQMIEGSTTQTYDGTTVRWYPYMFDFEANPTTSTFGVLKGNPGWHSGLAQGGVLGALSELYVLTGDQKWMDYGAETFESFMVPLAEGGITNRENGFLWFEEYPTVPVPTTVLNGHMEAMIGLDIWYNNSGDSRARDLFDEAVADLEPYLGLSEVEVDGGLATSYELVRGYPFAALRFLPDDEAEITEAKLNDTELDLPVAEGGVRGPNRIFHSDLNNINYGRFSADNHPLNQWTVLNANPANPDRDGGKAITWFGSSSTDQRGVRVRTAGPLPDGGWRGVQQYVPMVRADGGANFQAGEWLTLSFDSRLTYVDPKQPGIAGKVAVYSRCPVGGKNETALLYESQRTRSGTWATYNHTFQAPASNCVIQVQLVSASYGNTNTYVWYDDVTLTTAEPDGDHVQPVLEGDDLLVYKEPTTTVHLTGTGSGFLQVHADGVWESVGEHVDLSPTSATDVVVPERYTGRNIHLAYHQNHIDELVAICDRTEDDYFAEYVARWKPLAPAHNGTAIPDGCRNKANLTARTANAQDMRVYDYLPADVDTPLYQN